MPFGRWNVAAKFERLMVTAIAKLDWKICLIYLDYRKYQTCNVVITTDDKKIDLTKQTLGRHQLIFAFSWCSFFGKQIV